MINLRRMQIIHHSFAVSAISITLDASFDLLIERYVFICVTRSRLEIKTDWFLKRKLDLLCTPATSRGLISFQLSEDYYTCVYSALIYLLYLKIRYRYWIFISIYPSLAFALTIRNISYGKCRLIKNLEIKEVSLERVRYEHCNWSRIRSIRGKNTPSFTISRNRKISFVFSSNWTF